MPCGALDPTGHLENLGDFLEDSLPVTRAAASNGGRDARIQVVFQDLRTDLVECSLDRLDLTDHVNAVLIFFNHPDDTTQVAFDGL
jgi:hypothetical protein